MEWEESRGWQAQDCVPQWTVGSSRYSRATPISAECNGVIHEAGPAIWRRGALVIALVPGAQGVFFGRVLLLHGRSRIFCHMIYTEK